MQKRKLYPHVAGAITVLGIGGVLVVNGPHFPGIVCPSNAITGLDCPGCGSTRAISALLDGDIAKALDHHALLPFAILLLLWAWAATFLADVSNRRFSHPLQKNKAAVITLIVVAGFAVARNMPWAIGNYLAA